MPVSQPTLELLAVLLADQRGELVIEQRPNTTKPAAVVNAKSPSRTVSAIPANAISAACGNRAVTSCEAKRTTGTFFLMMST